jgi:hypothetical protein
VSSDRGFRYGVVFLITLALVVFAIAVPDGPVTRAGALLLEAAALTVAVATSRAKAEVRRLRAITVAALGTLVVVLTAADVLSNGLVFALGGLLAFMIPATLVGGLVRMIRGQGVTLRAVSGALTIYLYAGLLFGWTIGVVEGLMHKPYFNQPDVEQGVRVYYSFTVLTTTGFGDYTPATAVGRALAVLEMLIGQLYLVTVIGVLIGGLVGSRRPG